MSKLIRLSSEESNFFGLKIGRAQVENLDINLFEDEIINNRYDVLRVRVDKQHVRDIESIESLPFSVTRVSAIIKYELLVAGLRKSAGLNSEMTIRVFKESDAETIGHILKSGSPKNPIGYCSTKGLEAFVSREGELSYLIDYYCSNYITNDKQIWIMDWRNKPVGFIASSINQGVLDTILAVILPEYRGQKILHEFMMRRNNYAIDNKLHALTNGARVDNGASTHVFSKFGMQVVGEDFVYHILPMLTKKDV